MDAASSPISFAHLLALSDERGVFEHARYSIPRRAGGYCVDDVSRALIVLARQPEPDTAQRSLTLVCLGFLEESIAKDGAVHNRMSAAGEWTDAAAFSDWWGRLLWALGVTAARAGDPAVRARARRAFTRAASGRSPFLRSTVFAALGAAELLTAHPDETIARALAADAATVFASIPDGRAAGWSWPEARLSYANAAVAEAMLTTGHALGDSGLEQRGLALLDFLLGRETLGDRLSVTGSGGRGPDDASPQFDQQPIEVAALADACARAFELTGDARWLDGVRMAWEWFGGANDADTVMYDLERGAGFDGLEREGRNENQGAESTIAALGTHQQAGRLAHRLAPAGVS